MVEVIDQLLIVFDCQMSLQPLHILNLLFVANGLLLHLTYHFVAALVALLHVCVTTMELLGLLRHVLKQLLLQVVVARSRIII